MRTLVAAVALLFALLVPAGAQTKAKSKTATKATEESASKDDESGKKESAGSKKASSGTTSVKTTGSDEPATAKKASASGSGKASAVTKTSATSKTKSSASKPATDETKENEGNSGDASAKKTADTGAKKTSGAGTKKPAAGKTSDKPAADDEGDAQAAKTSKSKTATKSGTKGAKAESSSATASGQDKVEKSTASNGASTASKAATTNGNRKTSKSIDKPPQDNAGEEPTRNSPVAGPNITLDPGDLANFDTNSKAVQRLLTLGLNLTRQGLTYRYGSSDPTSGGMDCSGTIYYLLKQAGVKEPPRDSSGLYLWAEKEGTLRRVSPTSLDDPALAEMRPGDLMFWEGTYEVQRDPPISHTMIYLGKEKATGLPVMVGASDGRTYGGVRRNGVSVFDFKLPRADSAARFVAYGRIPGIEKQK